MRRVILALLAGAILASLTACPESKPGLNSQQPAVKQSSSEIISGAGATFPYPIYSKWADAYHKVAQVGLNYQSIGSGGGIKQIEANTVTFGATDAPLGDDELNKYGLVQFPTLLGGIVPVVNIAGVKSSQLVLSGPVLANIYLGNITKWNDAAIKKLNHSANLPGSDIAVVYRSDGSGTTYNFTYYLAQVSAAWKTQVGVQKSVEWPTGIGAKGNEGVAATVGQTANSIGYVEYAYAKQNGLTWTDLINKAGKRVSPTADAFRAAAAYANWSSVPGYGVILANQDGATTWPMTAATFILMYKRPTDPAQARDALKFFAWAYSNGDMMALELNYIPLPESVVTSVKNTWAAEIKSNDGKPLYTGQ